jgi:hypothetical protein
MSVKYRHLLLLFYKISIPINAFLLALQNLKDTSAVEVRSRVLPNLPRQSRSGDLWRWSFKGPNSLRRPSRCWTESHRLRQHIVEATVMTSLRTVSCSSVPVSKRGTQREQTFRYPKISTISWTARCPTPSCAAISLTPFGLVWWARRLFACYAQLQRFSVDHSAADRRCPCFRP